MESPEQFLIFPEPSVLSAAILKKSAIFTVPLLILVAAALLLPRLATLPPVRRELLEMAPYAVAAAGIFLAVHFHRGRPFFVLLLLMFFYWNCRRLSGDNAAGIAAQGTMQAFTLLLPLNLTLFCFVRERGILTAAGRLRMMFLIVQGSVASWIFHNRFTELQPYLGRELPRLPLLQDLTVSQPALLVTVLCMILIGWRVADRQSPIDSGFLGAVLALFIACNRSASADIPVVFCTAAALMVTLSVLQDSYNMAFRDDLTGLPSRRALNENLLGLGRRYVIAMVDVDHFKRFNDTYGHDVGDQVLKMVGKKLLGVGGGGRSYRYGGEEFTILFPRRGLAETMPHLEKVRQDIAEYRLFIRGTSRPKDGNAGKVNRGKGEDGTFVSVTVSIGVADNSDGSTAAADVIRTADKALYRAKSKGRNQVCR